MSAPYHRTAEQRSGDFADARAWEEHIAAQVPVPTITAFDSTTRLDIWVPGWYIEAKEKKQRYGERWQKHRPDVAEANLFIIDELTVRRGLEHWPHVFYLLRDRPNGGRLFWAPIWELVSVERARVNRVGKGKWLIDMSLFRPVASEADTYNLALSDLSSTPWKGSAIMSPVRDIPQA